MDNKKDLLEFFGIVIKNAHTAEIVNLILHLLIVIIGAAVLYFILNKWLSVIIWKIFGKTKNHWDDILYQQHFFDKLAYIVPPVASYILLEYITWEYVYVLQRLVDIWMVIVSMVIFNALLSTINKIYESYPIAKNRPITVFIQLLKIFVYTVVVVVVVSIMVDKSPEHLIVGLGAFAAVLMLIFKDSILGFVAGVQLLANKMIHIGDWIVMPSNNADGKVLEINLYTVKVQNWDMTISTIPTYQLVSQSFINWRGMQESDGRRIERYVNVDISTIHFLSKEEVEDFRTSIYLKDYIEKMMKTLEDINKDKGTLLDERKMTNLGVFMQYMELWLEANPDINNNMTHMVRQLQPTATGIPVEIYCFSLKQEWVSYEKIQSDIFNHLLAVVPHFNLKVFQYPTDKFTPGT